MTQALSPSRTPEALRAASLAYHYANRERRKAQMREYARAKREAARERYKTWAKANPEKYHAQRSRSQAKRRAQKAGVLLTIKVESDDCGVCLLPLNGDSSIGHEPPLSVVAREGWLIVVERPEHLLCNTTKKDRTDAEL